MSHEWRVDHRRRDIVEAGPEAIDAIPASAVIILPQVRKTMEHEPLADLKASIGHVDDDGQLHLDLLHPLTVADLDPEYAAPYIADVNMFWGTAFKLEDFSANPLTGRYAFLISGHRRLSAVTELAAEHGFTPEQVHIASSPRRNISFGEALALQLKENVYHQPDPTEIAEAIRLCYDFMRIDNPSLTQAGCAEALGFTPGRISRALAYSDLPDEIKGWVKNKDMSFNLAVTLGRIQEEYRRRFGRMKREGLLAESDDFTTAEQYAAYEIQTFGYRVYAMLQRSRRASGRAMEFAGGQLNSMRTERQFAQDPLDFMVMVESAKTRRQRAVGELARFAFRGFAAAIREDDTALVDALAEDPHAAAMLEQALRRHYQQTGRAETLF
ncbi:MAG TPA: hypothetical protein VLA88_04960 [Candidatus Saccharimonadales bacterium]|nr:hypothetical protein [Candidatus Saccharimonadales bacterium]